MHNVAFYLMNSISRIWIDPIKIAGATVSSLTQNPNLLILRIGRTCYKHNITLYQNNLAPIPVLTHPRAARAILLMSIGSKGLTKN